jgi:hypothetical protein
MVCLLSSFEDQHQAFALWLSEAGKLLIVFSKTEIATRIFCLCGGGLRSAFNGGASLNKNDLSLFVFYEIKCYQKQYIKVNLWGVCFFEKLN